MLQPAGADGSFRPHFSAGIDRYEHAAGSRRGRPYRHARPHQGAGGRARGHGQGARRHPALGRAAERGRHRRRRADDRRRAHGPAAPRRTRSPTATAATRSSPTARRPRTASSWCRRWSNRMAALTDLTIAGALDGLAKKQFSSKELTEAHVARRRGRARPQRLHHGDAGPRAGDGQGLGRAPRQGRRRACSRASRSPSRICSAPRAC